MRPITSLTIEDEAILRRNLIVAAMHDHDQFDYRVMLSRREEIERDVAFAPLAGLRLRSDRDGAAGRTAQSRLTSESNT